MWLERGLVKQMSEPTRFLFNRKSGKLLGDGGDSLDMTPPPDGCVVQSEVKLPDGVTLYRNALVLPTNLGEEDWKALGSTLAERHESLQWWLGDWWRHGSHKYGRRARLFAKGIFRHSFETLMNYGSVAAAIPTSFRNEVLSFSHHAAVTSLPRAEQKEMLAKAERFGWTVKELREIIYEKQEKSQTDQEKASAWAANVSNQLVHIWAQFLDFQIVDEYGRYLSDEDIATLVADTGHTAEVCAKIAKLNLDYQKRRMNGTSKQVEPEEEEDRIKKFDALLQGLKDD
jgi:hypothetical protein